MKRLFLLLSVLFASITAFAHDFWGDYKGKTIYFNISSSINKTLSVTYSGSSPTKVDNEYSGDIEIPSTFTYNGITYTITSIGDSAFYWCNDLTSVIIPNSVTSIGNNAFTGCSSLTSISIPKSVTSIGNWAFSSCSSLTSISIPNSVTSIGNNAFSVCSRLTNVYITNLEAWLNITFGDESANPLYYAANLYLNDSKVENLVIPNSITEIKPYAFRNYKGIHKIIIPNSVTSIGDKAFYECTNLNFVINYSNLSINKASTSYGYVAYYANKVAEIDIDSIEQIDNYLYGYKGSKTYLLSYTGNDTKVVISNNVSYIGESAFSNRTKLTSVVIPAAVESIGNQAFYGCNNLYKVIVMPNTVPTGFGNAFQALSGRQTYVGNHNYDDYTSTMGTFNVYTNLSSMIDVDGVTYVVDPVTRSVDAIDCSYDTSLTDITVPSNISYKGVQLSVNCIKSHVFRNFTEMTSITIGGEVQSIGADAFYKCTSLATVTFEDGENPITVSDNLFFTSPITEVHLDRDITYTAGYSPFKIRTTLTNIFAAGSKTSIKSDEFRGCYAIQTISTGGNISTIEDNAFISRTALTTVSLDGKNLSIGNSAFSGCTELASLTLETNVAHIGNAAFMNCSKIRSNLRLGQDKDVTIGDDAFMNCSAITSFTLGGNVLSIGANAFKNCGLIQRFNLGSRLTSIGEGAFENCATITSITIPATVGQINDRTFAGCTSLASVTMPNSLSSIGDYAFTNTPALTSVAFPEVLSSLGAHAFDGCAIMQAQVPVGVTELAEGVFANSGLQSFTVRSSVRSIGNSAFTNCPALKTLNIEAASTRLELGIDSTNKGLFSTCGIEDLYLGRALNYDETEAGGYSPFYGNHSLKTVTVNEYARTVGARMFQNCTALETITLSGEVISLGAYAFAGSGIQTINFPVKVTAIPSYCFYGCPRLTTLNIPETVKSIENYAFAASGMQTLVLPNSVETISDHLFYQTQNLESVTLAPTTKTIGEYAFSQSSLPSLVVPNSVQEIKTAVFDGTTALANLTIEDGSTSLVLANAADNKGLFTNVPIQNLYIGRELSYNPSSGYGYSPFYHNSTLRTVTLGDIPTKVFPYEFKDCTALQNVTLGDAVTEISHYSFAGCASMESFTVGAAIHTLGDEAFSDCTNLTELRTYAPVPPTCGDQALADINKFNCTLYVPNGSETNYASADQWREFFFVEGFDAGIRVSYIELSQTTASIGCNGTVQLSATCYPTTAMLRSVTWSSNNTEVATVSSTGLVTGLRAGYADIIATAADGSGVKATCRLTVTGDDETYSYRFEMYNLDVYPDVLCMMPVALINDGTVLAFQCDVVLPTGVTLAKDEYNDYYIEYTERASRHQASIAEEDGIIHIAGYNMNNSPIQGNSGVLFYLPIIATGNQRDCTLSIRNIHLSKDGNFDEELTPVSATLSVQPSYISGDANGDGVISVTDFTMAICYIINQPVANFIFAAADVDGDGKILIADATSILSKALSGVANVREKREVAAISANRNATNRISLSDIAFNESGLADAIVKIENAADYVACQFDLQLPEGVSLTNAQTLGTNARRHEAFFETDETGSAARIIVASFGNSQLTDNELVQLTFSCNRSMAAEGAEVPVINAIGVTRTADTVESATLLGNVANVSTQTSGIADIDAEGGIQITAEGRTLRVASAAATQIVVADILGRVSTYNVEAGISTIQLPCAGVYIVNNQKIIVK